MLLITYDLHERGGGYDYGPVYRMLLGPLAARQLLQSVWVTEIEQSPEELKVQLLSVMHAMDRLFIGQVGDSVKYNLLPNPKV